MKIAFVDILNFRKLKACRIDLDDKQTLFVGANNSGKTSAMDALTLFFRDKKFTTRDFTLFNWTDINKIGETWIREKDKTKLEISATPWEEYLPTLDVWLEVKNNEIHHVSHLIPSLAWTGGLLGVRLRLEPKMAEELYQDFISEFESSELLTNSAEGKKTKFKGWPKNLWNFLEKDDLLMKYFTIRAYLLDPAQSATPQRLVPNMLPLEESAFNGLIKVDIINAQRGFSDVNTEGGDTPRVKNLSSQLRAYYEKHLNPSLRPTTNDLDALQAIDNAKELFDKNLMESFSVSLRELEGMNYPGFGNPTIKLSSRLNAAETINHDTAVIYSLDGAELSLPEKYNGLGYQNLISMIFKLIRFRDEWMRVGKRAGILPSEQNEVEFEPLQLILIEEPEAHLHAQVQQVFIREAFKVLRNHKDLGSKEQFRTQLLISTHSNHIAHETEFTSLRYFKRETDTGQKVATSTVVNLSKTFGNPDDTMQFAIRYLRTTHCDLFFADAVILVEGPAERMLIPYFIKKYSRLHSCYLSILEIGGSHAHTLQRLIDKLGILTLIVTDIDTINPAANGAKAQTASGSKLLTGNDTLKSWWPKQQDIDKLLTLDAAAKVATNGTVRVAYQIGVGLEEKKSKGKSKIVVAYPYTFEDSLVMENQELFAGISTATGLLKKMKEACQKSTVPKVAEELYKAITTNGAKKAEFALELLYLQEPEELKTPTYIMEGLKWLEEKLIKDKQGFNTEKKPNE